MIYFYLFYISFLEFYDSVNTEQEYTRAFHQIDLRLYLCTSTPTVEVDIDLINITNVMQKI